ncbi:TetR/AcrR family transcriptional regulator [Nonomuraea sp. NEAU-A123]|uniref:TetR/AcrR family transcriptional regulator n=1 Tax=Nonomuraea sp. NEAU-A123 TaxID=2839649 RepID=UPI001BE454FE|nr:TetR/AcrR family transcriptional regulator [Nonomuraea sp. NEAU-A123]MBT2233661.1 TetR family transcriptional regulator [Nonomuraea sp. NEAU-A123]
MAGRTARPERGGATRELILATAERLYAEHGVHAVSNRQISEAAGQGNSAAVGYHFGTKADLVRAIARKHADQMEELRMWMVADAAGSTDVRDWVACLVRPFIRHLAAQGSPTWYARFRAQVMADPALYQITIEESLPSPSLRLLVDGLNRCISDLPPEVREARWAMARHVIVHMCVERERALAEGTPTLQPSWDDLAASLIDAIVGLWLAPVTHRS